MGSQSYKAVAEKATQKAAELILESRMREVTVDEYRTICMIYADTLAGGSKDTCPRPKPHQMRYIQNEALPVIAELVSLSRYPSLQDNPHLAIPVDALAWMATHPDAKLPRETIEEALRKVLVMDYLEEIGDNNEQALLAAGALALKFDTLDRRTHKHVQPLTPHINSSHQVTTYTDGKDVIFQVLHRKEEVQCQKQDHETEPITIHKHKVDVEETSILGTSLMDLSTERILPDAYLPEYMCNFKLRQLATPFLMGRVEDFLTFDQETYDLAKEIRKEDSE